MGIFSSSNVEDNNVGEWVAWGGMTRPTVMRQRGGSYFSVIAYQSYQRTIPLSFPDFRRGWVLMNKHQHYPARDGAPEYAMDYLVILWNPFVSFGGSYVENSLEPEGAKRRIAVEKGIDYFVFVVKKIQEELSRVTDAWILEYQDIMDFISFSVSLGDDHVEMPEVPLYMDYLLTQNNEFTIGDNSIQINGKQVFVVSLADIIDSVTYYAFLVNLPYRHIKRVLCFNKEETKAEIKKYTGSWCKSRRSMKSYLMQDVASNLNGYYYEGLFFHLLPTQKDFPSFLRKRFDSAGLFYRFETYNLKDCWWGSLPGNFLANVVPPTTGFSSLEDILGHPLDVVKVEEKKQFDEELIQSLTKKKVSDGESSGAMFETQEQMQKKKEGLEYDTQNEPILP